MCFPLHLGSNGLRGAPRRASGTAGVRVIFQTGWSFPGGKPGFETRGHSGAEGGSIGVAGPRLDTRRSWYVENVSVIDRLQSCTQETARARRGTGHFSNRVGFPRGMPCCVHVSSQTWHPGLVILVSHLSVILEKDGSNKKFPRDRNRDAISAR